MSRVKGGNIHKKRRAKVLKLAKGYLVQNINFIKLLKNKLCIL